jgi:hypothetical protein
MKNHDLEPTDVEEAAPISPPPLDFADAIRRMSVAGEARQADVERELADAERELAAMEGEKALRDVRHAELMTYLVDSAQRRERLAALVEGLQPMSFLRSR